MFSLLLCSTPVHGHVVPLLAVSRALVAAGHDVRFLTGRRYRDAVEDTGASWIGLPDSADYDDSDFTAAFPGRADRRGVAAARWDLRNIFLRPAPDQLRAIDALLLERPADAVLTETLFFGAMLLLARPRTQRPAVLNLGIVPLGIRSRETAPFALGIPPRPGALGRIRNAVLTWTSDHVLFADLQRAAAEMARTVVGAHLPVPAMNYIALADAIVQFSVPEFEYPRPDVRTPVHFVGPVSLGTSSSAPLPDWWHDLDGRRPVIHVTQGTVANGDPEDLLLPTLRALAGRDAIVVASTGGAEIPRAALPANARIAAYLPYDLLFPRLSAFVTNGGYGGVHFALAHGVPVLATGDTEDKAEVAARVAWSGAGLRLKSRGRPAEPAIAAAVDRLLREPTFAENARRIGSAIAAAPGPAGIDEVLREVTTTGTTPVRDGSAA